MLGTNKSERQENEQEKQLSVGNRSFHKSCSPYMQEFSELIHNVSTEGLEKILLTHQQLLLAKAWWEAANYGGSKTKCEKQLEIIHGKNWKKITKVEDHMEPIRDYYEMVLRIDHERQWANVKKDVKLQQQGKSNP